MQRFLLVFVATIFATCLGSAAQTDAALERAIHLVVLHTNDVHGQALPRKVGADGARTVGGLGRVAAKVGEIRAEHVGPLRGVVVLDGGDWFTGTPEGQADGGWRFVEALVAVGYDAMTVGNHEWDFGEENLLKILESTRAPAVLANVRTAVDGPRHERFPPWRIVERAGLRIAVVGLATPSTPVITHADARRYAWTDPIDELRTVLGELPEGIDLVIPLTHVGHGPERDLALAFPELPLIVGGHSHTFVREPIDVNNTRVVQAGAKAEVLGRVDLWLDPATKKPLHIESRLIELDNDPAPELQNPDVERRIAAIARATEAEMAVVLGTLLADPMPGGSLESSGLGNWTADAMRRAMRAEIAVHNKAGIRSTLRKGEITRRDVFETAPFFNTVVAFELTGAELETVARRSFEGRGRRGFECSGMRVFLRDGPEFALVDSIEIDGEPLDPERRYRLATNSYLAAGGDRLFEVGRELVIDDSRRLLHTVLGDELVEAGELRLPEDARIVRSKR